MKNADTGRRVSAAFAAAIGLWMSAGMAPSAAQSLREIRAQEAEENALDREVAYTESVCGISMSARIDWRSAADWPSSSSLASACDGALGALEAICRNNAGRTKAKRINSFVCAGDGSGASLRGGSLRYGASPGDNGFSETKALLDSRL